MREVVYNAMVLHGEVFTGKIPFVVCEVRRPMLSMAMLEDKGFHLTVGDGCQKTWRSWSRDDSAKKGKLFSCGC